MDDSNSVNGEGRLTDRWLNDRLALLSPAADWQPNLARGFARLRERCEAQRGRERRWSWTATGIVAASLPLMAFPATRAITQRCVSACVEESSRLRELLLGNSGSPALRSTFLRIEDRKMAPDFAVTDVSGKQVSLSDFRGKLVLLNFWATWCGPCRTEIPMLNELQLAHRDRGFTVLGVSLEQDGWSVVKPYMAAVRFNYPVVVGREDIAALYGGLEAVPTTLLIDKSGRIAALHVGICNRSEYEADIDAVLKEQ